MSRWEHNVGMDLKETECEDVDGFIWLKTQPVQ
jgi:hypothetical protein